MSPRTAPSHMCPAEAALRAASGKRYMLRRTLFPWKFRQTLDETARFADEFGIDEVVWKIDTEEFSHGLPTIALAETYVPWLERSRDQLARRGISMSVNPWATQGMRDAGWDLRAVFPDFEWMTDATGVQAKSQVCPLSPAWRRWLCEVFRRYASARPRVLWIEDDIRVHWHRPVRFACFCERHLREFGERVGRQLTREALLAEVLAPGRPSPLRRQWLDFLGGVVVDVVAELAEAVRAVSPETHLGLMCSAPWYHAMECRPWDALLAALAKPHEFVTLRPCMGNYEEASPHGLYASRQLVSGTVRCVRRPAHFCTEVEDWPFSRYAKSVRFVRAQLLLSAALRCPSMTLNLYDHLGTPLYDEPQYGRMLREARPRLDALAAAYARCGQEVGLGILMPEDGGKRKRLPPGADYGALSMSSEPWADILQGLGLTATWQPSPVCAASGPKLQAYEERLDDLLAGGLLLDLSAAEALIGLGKADLVGVDIAETFARAARVVPAEEPTSARFGAAGGRYMTVDHLGLDVRIGRLVLHAGARTISRLVDSDRRPVMPGFVLFENRLGGRVGVCPYDLSGGTKRWFMNPLRARQLRGIAAWLFRGAPPLTVEGGVWPLAVRTDGRDQTVVSLMNLSSDAWPEVRLTLSDRRGLQSAAVLGPKGRWSRPAALTLERRGPRLRVHLRAPLPPLDMVTLRLR